MILGATGALTTVNTGGASAYCAISGEWGVDAGRFTARGADCTGTIVTLTAPAVNTRLSGTWSATSGRSGTFDVTRHDRASRPARDAQGQTSYEQLTPRRGLRAIRYGLS